MTIKLYEEYLNLENKHSKEIHLKDECLWERGFDGGLDTSKKVYPGGIAKRSDGESDD